MRASQVKAPPLFKVHGAPCVQWLACEMPTTGRNLELEGAIKKAVKQEQERLAALKPKKVKPDVYTWVDPEAKGRPWSVICLNVQRAAAS